MLLTGLLNGEKSEGGGHDNVSRAHGKRLDAELGRSSARRSPTQKSSCVTLKRTGASRGRRELEFPPSEVGLCRARSARNLTDVLQM